MRFCLEKFKPVEFRLLSINDGSEYSIEIMRTETELIGDCYKYVIIKDGLSGVEGFVNVPESTNIFTYMECCVEKLYKKPLIEKQCKVLQELYFTKLFSGFSRFNVEQFTIKDLDDFYQNPVVSQLIADGVIYEDEETSATEEMLEVFNSLVEE